MTSPLNLDGLVGPSHNYAGLSRGNIASYHHSGETSSPKEAALQGLEKMWFLHRLGIAQGLLLPHPRPDLSLLQAAGFRGPAASLIIQASRQAPGLLQACYSAASMWAANCATVTASSDSRDQRVHLTPANLITTLHRSREAETNFSRFTKLFSGYENILIHPPLPAQAEFADEGAANHIRLQDPATDDALNLFIYGKGSTNSPKRFQARQSLQASQSIIRNHQLAADKTMLIQQHPKAIDQGAFHNDVVAVGLNNLLLLHETAWLNQPDILDSLRNRAAHWQTPLVICQITEQELPLNEAIKSYLFNSQLVSVKDDKIIMIAPEESRCSDATLQVVEKLLAEDNPLSEVYYLDLRQSMNNGGGPACLRIQFPLNAEELDSLPPTMMLNESRYHALKAHIHTHYRDKLTPKDLSDPDFYLECQQALAALQSVMA